MVRAHLLIDGRVQGVFYRGSCREEARRKGLSGWVRNLSDGRVEAVLEGTPERVEEMIRWCYRGPEEAQVTNIEVTYEPLKDRLEGFEIR
jgi:acylphosphatase